MVIRAEQLSGGLITSTASIQLALQHLAERAYSLDIATLGGATGDFAISLLRRPWRDCRVVIGEASRAANMAHACPKVRIRYLKDQHCKLFIFYTPRPVALLGSMNLGNGMAYECAVILRGQQAKDCSLHFSSLWNSAQPIEASSLSVAAFQLSRASFENPEGEIPHISTQVKMEQKTHGTKSRTARNLQR